MALAEPVPFLRWRTTQLAQFDLSFGLLNAARQVGHCSQMIVPYHFLSRNQCLYIYIFLLYTKYLVIDGVDFVGIVGFVEDFF